MLWLYIFIGHVYALVCWGVSISILLAGDLKFLRGLTTREKFSLGFLAPIAMPVGLLAYVSLGLKDLAVRGVAYLPRRERRAELPEARISNDV